MKDAYERARKVIKLNIKSLEAIKDALLERETLDDEDVTDLFKAAKNVV